jgi:hypothetical protein
MNNPIQYQSIRKMTGTQCQHKLTAIPTINMVVVVPAVLVVYNYQQKQQQKKLTIVAVR